jgi:primosomal protein N'
MYPSMLQIQKNWNDNENNSYMTEQTNYQPQEEKQCFQENINLLNAEQHSAFNAIYSLTCAQQGKTFFLHSPAGMGKTFVYRTLCHRIRANG